MVISNRGKPDWLKIRPPTTEKFVGTKEILRKHGLHTVCEESHCPNIPECWSGGTATFMVMGKTCTRGCRFCNVESSGNPLPLDPFEPENLAGAVADMGLDYVVVTSVDRDDLPDQGSSHFAECIRSIKKSDPEMLVEVLIPDFRGDVSCLKTVVDAEPDVIAHNIETVRRLTPKIRDRRANYDQSLFVLKKIKELNPKIFTKSSIIVGFGETDDEMLETMRDLRSVGVDFLTIGQYLRPSDWHVPVEEYVKPEKFDSFRKMGEGLGFKYVASGPFVRSSYRAGEFFIRNAIKNSEEAERD
jgi:lipoic acid synthetase